MSVDKFGHFSQGLSTAKPGPRGPPGPQGPPGPEGKGFNVTQTGDFDIGGKRLKRTLRPKDNDDAATKQYVDLKIDDNRRADVNNYNNWTKRMNALEQNINQTNQNVSEQGTKLKHLINDTKDIIDNKLQKAMIEVRGIKSHFDRKASELEKKIDSMDAKVDNLKLQFETDFKLIITSINSAIKLLSDKAGVQGEIKIESVLSATDDTSEESTVPKFNFTPKNNLNNSST